MTNAKVYQGFCDDKKVEEHCSTFNTSSDIYEKNKYKVVRILTLSEVNKVLAIYA